jgi:methylene-fatty-acyl-phospholipid synthase
MQAEIIQKASETLSLIAAESQRAIQAIDTSQSTLWLSVFTIVFSPTYWNIVGRNEYHKKTLTKLFGSKELGCYVFAATIFTLGLVRDQVFNWAIQDQPRGPEHFPLLAVPEVVAFGYIISTIGSVFVLSSMYRLGIHGTYLGDHFGIIMKERVTGFPFNVTNNPMYYGSTMVFMGTAIWYCSPVGVLLSLWVLFIYLFFTKVFEQPFTNQIYSKVKKE